MEGSLIADDPAIHTSIRNQTVATRALQEVTNMLDTWTVERELTFSPSKAVNIIFKKRREKL